jgi:predicted RND superfamily exporter protein
VDFAIEEMRSGKDRLTALLEAGHKRARPIVMTSVAMIAGMVPVALVASASFQAQMAIAVIGGLVTSTGLTLVMVPATFTWIDDLERWVSRKIGPRWINSASVAAASASGAVETASEPGPVVLAVGAASPAVQPTIGHPRDLPGGPLPDAAR